MKDRGVDMTEKGRESIDVVLAENTCDGEVSKEGMKHNEGKFS